MNPVYAGPLRYVAGSTAPILSVRIEAHPVDPTGAGVEFLLVDLFTDYLATLTGIPDLGTVSAVSRDGLTTYDFGLQFEFAAGDLVAGTYYGRFILTDGAEISAIPADRSMVIEVLPEPQAAP